MTKSTITREQITSWMNDANYALEEPLNADDAAAARAILAMGHELLAAMDSESECLPLDYLQGHKDGLEWAAQLAEANHPETGDWLYDDPIELAKAIRKGPDMPPAQPVADSEPVIVVGDDGGDALSYRRLIQSFEPGTKLYRHTQPAPVVPDDVLAALQKVARIRLDMNDFDGDRRGIADCLGDAEEALIEVVNRRAAMLAAAPQEVK
ncbi:hypothetical protein LZ588_08875 [Klebsiella pneumoniae]|uniref:hypothetical protein n=1 Tax=Klebsiella pneumoniae TaxID=573 RepID=UPI001F3A7DAC|nr:hypothetical protein [Klebsiella pneumoniae]MCF2841969.1 hypothetical protein [Klebsiella pneumoniae]